MPDLRYPLEEFSAECLFWENNGEGDQQIGEGSMGAGKRSTNTQGTQWRSLRPKGGQKVAGRSGTSHIWPRGKWGKPRNHTVTPPTAYSTHLIWSTGLLGPFGSMTQGQFTQIQEITKGSHSQYCIFLMGFCKDLHGFARFAWLCCKTHFFFCSC